MGVCPCCHYNLYEILSNVNYDVLSLFMNIVFSLFMTYANIFFWFFFKWLVLLQLCEMSSEE